MRDLLQLLYEHLLSERQQHPLVLLLLLLLLQRDYQLYDLL
jgi:hypothetical protein